LGHISILKRFFSNPSPTCIPEKKSQEGLNMAQEKCLGKIVGLEIFDGPGNFQKKNPTCMGFC